LSARIIIEAGADVNHAAKNGTTALIWACEYGQESCARLLIEERADTSKESARGTTALSVAREKGLSAICELLEA
jgi:ankyrin repeat protein